MRSKDYSKNKKQKIGRKNSRKNAEKKLKPKKKEEDRLIKEKEEEDRLIKEKEEEDRLIKEREEEDKKALELKKKREEEERNRIKSGQLISIQEVDVKPIPISTPAPKLNRSMKLRQRVIATALIDHFGNVEKARMLTKSRNKKIDSIIIQTILSWKYKPALKDGVNVKVWKTISLK